MAETIDQAGRIDTRLTTDIGNEIAGPPSRRKPLFYDVRLAPVGASLHNLCCRLSRLNGLNGRLLRDRYAVPYGFTQTRLSDSHDQKNGRENLLTTDGLAIAAICADLRITVSRLYTATVQAYVPWRRLTAAEIRSAFAQEIRHCPECIAVAYHTPLFQLNSLTKCPQHRVALVTCCPNCNAKYSSSLLHISPAEPFTCNGCAQTFSQHTNAVDWLTDSSGGIEGYVTEYLTWCRTASSSITAQPLLINSIPNVMRFRDQNAFSTIHDVLLVANSAHALGFEASTKSPAWLQSVDVVDIGSYSDEAILSQMNEFTPGVENSSAQSQKILLVQHRKSLISRASKKIAEWERNQEKRHPECLAANRRYFQSPTHIYSICPCTEMLGYRMWLHLWRLWDGESSTLSRYCRWLQNLILNGWRISAEKFESEISQPANLSAASVFFAGELALSTALNHLSLINLYLASISEAKASLTQHVESHVPIDLGRPRYAIFYTPKDRNYLFCRWDRSQRETVDIHSQRDNFEHSSIVNDRLKELASNAKTFGNNIDTLLHRERGRIA